MATYESILKFNGYIVDEINFKRNENFDFLANKDLRTKFHVKQDKKIEENIMRITLYVSIFEKANENNYPYEMNVTLTGIFDISNAGNIDFEPNAIAILYPYVRSLVSTYTINANVGATILPPINIIEMLKQQKEDNI